MKASLLLSIGLGCALAGGACHDGTAPLSTELKVTLVASGFDRPLLLTSPPGDSRLFIVEKTGRIRIIKNGQVLVTPFLDLSGAVVTQVDQGLLGLAFHPNFAVNGRFFVYYTDLIGNNQVDEYTAGSGADVASVNSRVSILTIPNPSYDHHAGMLVFAPDGKLIVAVGDGGIAAPNSQNSQDLTKLLGKLLRLDVDAGSPYAVPADNPFASSATARHEIWAYGLRNPWRFSIDHGSGLLYLGDVGFNNWEEIDVAPLTDKGVNWGWDVMEGLTCATAGCDTTAKRLPVIAYPHTEGCAVIGGYVYRGLAMPAQTGKYFFSDYCAGFLRSFSLLGGIATDYRTWEVGLTASVQSMGEDSAGEVYLLLKDGRVFRLEPR